MSSPLDNLTDVSRKLLYAADELGYEVKVSTHGDIMSGQHAKLIVRLHPTSDVAKRRFKAAGREDRVIEAAAVMHPDDDLAPFALEFALVEALKTHNDHLGLALV